MRVKTLLLRLLDDVLVARVSHTIGARETLDHIPGSALLGAAAGALYRTLDATQAWKLFHSGAVRFGPAVPARETKDGVEIGVPAPLSLHFLKKVGRADAEKQSFSGLFNRLHPGDVEGQLEQLRETWLYGDGAWLRPKRNAITRTAITPGVGSAAEGQLFTYEALAGGQSFVATLEFDDDVAERDVAEIVEALSGRIHIGRSKNAEYGRVEVRVVDADPYAELRKRMSLKGELAVFCLSDIALPEDSVGDARALSAAFFGLQHGDLCWSRSFVRQRTLSHYNAALRAYEPERAIIEKGSVLLFENAAHDGAALHDVGRAREAGYGRVWIAPAWLSRDKPTAFKSLSFAGGNLPHMSKRNLPENVEKRVANAVGLLQLRSGAGGQGLRTQWAQEKADELRGLYVSAAALAGENETAAGPSASQWGGVLQVASEAKDSQALRASLFGDNGLCKKKNKRNEIQIDEQWGILSVNDEGAFISFCAWLEAAAGSSNIDLDAFRLLAREGMNVAKEVLVGGGRGARGRP